MEGIKSNDYKININSSFLYSVNIFLFLYQSVSFQRTHVFIDEAAQVIEPDVGIAVSDILSNGGQLVLAGDHKQLGPILNSKIAAEKGLGK